MSAFGQGCRSGRSATVSLHTSANRDWHGFPVLFERALQRKALCMAGFEEEGSVVAVRHRAGLVGKRPITALLMRSGTKNPPADAMTYLTKSSAAYPTRPWDTRDGTARRTCCASSAQK